MVRRKTIWYVCILSLCKLHGDDTSKFSTVSSLRIETRGGNVCRFHTALTLRSWNLVWIWWWSGKKPGCSSRVKTDSISYDLGQALLLPETMSLLLLHPVCSAPGPHIMLELEGRPHTSSEWPPLPGDRNEIVCFCFSSKPQSSGFWPLLIEFPEHPDGQ